MIVFCLFWLLTLSFCDRSGVAAFVGTDTHGSFAVRQPYQQQLHASMEQTVVLDGAEWQSVKKRLNHPHNSDYGIFTVVVTEYNQKRVCAIKDTLSEKATQSDDDIPIYKSSIAEIPKSISDEAALWTMIQSLSVFCALPVTNIGGDSQATTLPNPKIVILGGNDCATQAARVLVTLNCEVTVVSQNNVPGRSIQRLAPEDDFGEQLKQFDSVLDVLGDEPPETIALLRKLHGCQTYVSLHSESQSIIEKSGLIWGPGKAKEYMSNLQKKALSASNGYLQPPEGFGGMVESLFDANVILPKQKSDAIFVRNWSLKDFWENTKWPRHVESSTRFGLPVEAGIEEEEEEGAPMVSAPPMPGGDPEQYMLKDPIDEASPFITWVTGVSGLNTEIVDNKSSAVLFLSAPYCRTCRYLKPKYQRMAKEYSEEHPDFSFCKADASGIVGKQLGRTLGVNFVPSFVLFRNGERYGKPLAISKLPSKKLDLAIQYLQENKPWDESVFTEEDDGRKTKRNIW